MILVTYFVLGRLLVWSVQTSGATKWFWNLNKYLTELGECDFCIGVWIFPPFAYVMGINLLSPIYVPFVSEIITGIASSFVTHLARVGWNTKYGITYLDN